MRLVRFLAAGKSLVGLKDVEGRYRLPHGRALPQFGVSKDAGVSAGADSTHQPLEEAHTPPAPSADDTRVAHKKSDTDAAESLKPSQPKGVPPQKSGRIGKGFIFRKLFGWLPWYRGTPSIGSIPAFSKLPVQTELSLENVKVVRNDLSESDLEVKSAQLKQATISFSKQQIGERTQGATNVEKT